MADVDKLQPEGPETPQTPSGTGDEAKQPTPAPVLFGGKTPEAFAEEFKHTQEALASLTEKLSKTEHEAQYARTLLERMAQGKAEPSAPATEPSLSALPDDQFFASPGRASLETAQRVYDAGMNKFRAQMEVDRQRERDDSARVAFERTGAQAIGSNPKLYQGIEDRVRNEIATAYQNKRISANEIGDQRFWESTAATLRFLGGDWDLQKYRSNVPAPAIPGGIEAPSPAMPPQGSITLSSYEEDMLNQPGMKISKEQYLEQKRKDLEREGR